MGLGTIRLESQGMPAAGFCLVELAQSSQSRAAVTQSLDAVRLEAQCLIITGKSVSPFSQVGVSDASIEMRLRNPA